MAAAAFDGRSHYSAMRMAAFSSSYDEVIAAPRCCFVRRVVGLAGSPSVTTIPTPRCCQTIGIDDESGIQVSDE